MIGDLLYRCPLCGVFDWIENDHCASCNVSFAIISRSLVSIGAEIQPISHWYKKVRALELPAAESGVIMKSRRVRLSREAQEGIYKGYAGITAFHFTRAQVDLGTLCLKEDALSFTGAKGTIDILFDKLLGVTIESNTVIVISRDHGPLFFDFIEESGKKWEDLIQKALVKHHAPNNILEFYPRVRLQNSLRERPPKIPGHKTLRVPERRWYPKDKSGLSSVLKPIVRPLLKTLLSLNITGLENIPDIGAAVVVFNHTSFLDSIILGFFTRRDIWFMAKNSEYRNCLMKWFLRHASSFPVRRYTIDILAIRNALRVVQHGHILGIFPEGERTWDGEMLPLRIGTIRLLLALGFPVIPVGISGAYELMPRWTSSIKRFPVSITIGKPMDFPHIPIPKQSRGDIESASMLLRTKMAGLIQGNA